MEVKWEASIIWNSMVLLLPTYENAPDLIKNFNKGLTKIIKRLNLISIKLKYVSLKSILRLKKWILIIIKIKKWDYLAIRKINWCYK